MNWSTRQRRMYALSIVFAAVPFAFGLIRYEQTGCDLRYVWVALASLLGATLVMVVGNMYSGTLKAGVALSAGAFVVATLFAVLAAVRLGTRVGPGLLVVASAFGVCCAASCLLHALARPRVL